MNIFHKYDKALFGVKISSIIGGISRIVLGIIFILAAVGKIPNIATFEVNVASYHILPLAIVPAFSFITAWFELIIGIYLIIGLFTIYTTYITLFLLVVYIIAITYAILTNQPVSGCGCFAQVNTPIGWADDIRDIGFIILGIIILAMPTNILSIDHYIHRRKRS